MINQLAKRGFTPTVIRQVASFEELRILLFAGEVLVEIAFHFIENHAARRVNRQNRTVFIKRPLIYHEEDVDVSRFICYAYQ